MVFYLVIRFLHLTAHCDMTGTVQVLQTFGGKQNV